MTEAQGNTSRRGRKKLTHDQVRCDAYVSEPVLSQVKLLLLDPTREKVRYGALSELIEGLLVRWLDDKKRMARGEMHAFVDRHKVLMALTKLKASAVDPGPAMQEVLRLLEESLT